jgi:hypothetical protein
MITVPIRRLWWPGCTRPRPPRPFFPLRPFTAMMADLTTKAGHLLYKGSDLAYGCHATGVNAWTHCGALGTATPKSVDVTFSGYDPFGNLTPCGPYTYSGGPSGLVHAVQDTNPSFPCHFSATTSTSFTLDCNCCTPSPPGIHATYGPSSLWDFYITSNVIGGVTKRFWQINWFASFVSGSSGPSNWSEAWASDTITSCLDVVTGDETTSADPGGILSGSSISFTVSPSLT